jgi:hypothetical protein
VSLQSVFEDLHILRLIVHNENAWRLVHTEVLRKATTFLW